MPLPGASGASLERYSYMRTAIFTTALVAGGLSMAFPAFSQPMISEPASAASSAIHYTATPVGSETDGPVGARRIGFRAPHPSTAVDNTGEEATTRQLNVHQAGIPRTSASSAPVFR
jgi:hypothetical protein